MGRSEEEYCNGSLKVPIGFRFQPSDEELLIHYLRRKILCLPLPATVILEFEPLQFNPWDLPGELKEKRYFFSKRKRSYMMNKKCSSSSTDCGYWKSSGKDKQIMSAAAGNTSCMIGMKKSYVFYHTLQGRRRLKTQWVMQELCLLASLKTPFLPHHHQGRVLMQVGDWVVCRLYQRKRRSTTNNFKYLKNELPETTPSSPCASGITEISSDLDDQDQEASSTQSVLAFD